MAMRGQFKTLDGPCIYSIHCPFSGNIVYIGKTENQKARFSAHLQGKSNSAIGNYIKILKLNNKKPIFNILESIKPGQFQVEAKEYREIYSGLIRLECHYINFYRNKNYILLNMYPKRNFGSGINQYLIKPEIELLF